MIEAVVFDMDGVLFDTEYLICNAWMEIAKELKLVGMKEVLLKCIGRNYAESKRIFLEHYQEIGEFDQLRERADGIVHQRIEAQGMPMKEGVYELLQFLKDKGYKIGLASSTHKERVLAHLRRAGMEQYFTVIIGGDMVSHSKPHPEIYQKACKALGVPPELVFCIEDSPSGIRSAHAAGLQVIMVPDLIQPTEEISVLLHKQYTSLLEVKSYLESLDNRITREISLKNTEYTEQGYK